MSRRGSRAASFFAPSSYDLGSVVVSSGQFLLQFRRITLSGSDRLTLSGTADCIVTDLTAPQGRVVIGGQF